MVKKKHILVLIYIIIIFAPIICYMFITCRNHNRLYTYYCKQIDFKFQIIEKDTCDILVFGDNDSIFYSAPYNGNYLGVDFLLSVDSNTIYLGPYFPTIYHQISKNYHIKRIKQNLFVGDLYEPYKNRDFWDFFGGCDQGSYTFNIMHNSKFVESIKPLEWSTHTMQ